MKPHFTRCLRMVAGHPASNKHHLPRLSFASTCSCFLPDLCTLSFHCCPDMKREASVSWWMEGGCRGGMLASGVCPVPTRTAGCLIQVPLPSPLWSSALWGRPKMNPERRTVMGTMLIYIQNYSNVGLSSFYNQTCNHSQTNMHILHMCLYI